MHATGIRKSPLIFVFVTTEVGTFFERDGVGT